MRNRKELLCWLTNAFGIDLMPEQLKSTALTSDTVTVEKNMIAIENKEKFIRIW